MTSEATIGDGTTVGTRTLARWRASKGWLALAAIVVVIAAFTAVLTSGSGNGTALDPDNSGTKGSRALAQVLGANGVRVHRTTTVADTLAATGPGRTLVITNPDDLRTDVLDRVVSTGADVVLLDPSPLTAAGIDGRLVSAETGRLNARSRRCDVPVARQAERATSSGSELEIAEEATSDRGLAFCFGRDSRQGSYVVVERGSYTITLMLSPDVVSNAFITENDNAALALGTLGRHGELTWLVADYSDPANDVGTGSNAPGARNLVPPWVLPVTLLLFVALVPLFWWRGRRLGRLVREPLPVVVRSTETAEGRAMLYRRVGAYDRALEVMQAAALQRAAARLGLASTTPREQVIAAWAAAVNVPETGVAQALSPSPGIGSAGLISSVAAIDRLSDQLAGTVVAAHHPEPTHPKTQSEQKRLT